MVNDLSIGGEPDLVGSYGMQALLDDLSSSLNLVEGCYATETAHFNMFSVVWINQNTLFTQQLISSLL